MKSYIELRNFVTKLVIPYQHESLPQYYDKGGGNGNEYIVSENNSTPLLSAN